MRLLIAHRSTEARTALADAVRRGAKEPVEVTTSGDGPETLELLLQDEPPEVAMVDWDLPGIEGPEMCRLVRDFHHGHDTWLVVLAGSGHRATSEAWRAGADDCVSTPAPAADLRVCVEKGMRAMRAPRTPVDDTDMEPEVEGPRATLDAMRAPDGGGGSDFFGFAGADLRATAEPRDYGMTAGAETAAADEPRGAALLEAVLHQL
jgi:DNA-binding response OmpR family regulator